MVLANRAKLQNSRSLVRVFGGLNETYACSEAEYSAGVNFSARDFPALSTRKPRRKLRELTGLNGMYHLNGHDGRKRSGYARLLNIDQRLHGAVLQAVERSAILQKREIATRAAHVGHTRDQTRGLLRNIDVDRQRLGVVGSVLLGEHDIAAASRSVNQSLHCEVQAAIVGIIIGKPARRPLAYRHIELDIGRYRNIECLSLHI